MNIPFLDLKRQYINIKDEVNSAVMDVVESGRYIGGDKLDSFEKNVASYLGVKHAIGVSSGTDALLASLMAIGIGNGDEVITSPFTFIATAEVISFLGAKPVFVDIEEESFNINPDLIEEKITEKTRAIVPVHLFGQMAEMGKIMEIADRYNIPVIEDAAQAIGATYNGKYACSFGKAGCLSFFPSKNLGGFGDGGMVCTNDDEMAKAIRVIKEHGSEKRYHHSRIGFNGRLDSIQAAVLDVKLNYLEDWAEKRIQNAEYYTERLKDYVKTPTIVVNGRHVFNQYSIVVKERDKLVDFLAENGIPTVIYYPVPLHLQEVFRSYGYREGDFPVAEKISKMILSLPIFPELYDSEKEYIADKIIEFYK